MVAVNGQSVKCTNSLKRKSRSTDNSKKHFFQKLTSKEEHIKTRSDAGDNTMQTFYFCATY